jgi:hypothetical protein
MRFLLIFLLLLSLQSNSAQTTRQAQAQDPHPATSPQNADPQRLFQHLGRTQEAKAEMQTFTQMSNASREKRHQELEAGPMPNPELTQEPQ